MSKDTEANIKDLDARLESATVELESEKDRIYRVYVPGAIRTENRVKADSEEEAIKKVRNVLIQKIEDRAGREAPGTKEKDLEVQNAKQGSKSSDVGGSNG